MIGGAYLSLDQFKPAEEQLRRAITLDARVNGPRGSDRPPRDQSVGDVVGPDRSRRRGRTLLRRNLADCREVLGPDEPISLDAAERLGRSSGTSAGSMSVEATLSPERGGPEPRFQGRASPNARSIYLLSRLLRERRRVRRGQGPGLSLRPRHPAHGVPSTPT